MTAMNAHLLKTDVATADTNEVVPQVQHMGLGYDWDAPDSVTRISPSRPLEVAPRLDSFHLDPATRFTDAVSQSYAPAPGLLLSERLRRLLDEFDLQGHEWWPAEVTLGGETRPYWWLQPTEELEERVDYASSRFAIEHPDGSVEEVGPRTRVELDAIARSLVDSLAGTLKPRRVTFLPGTPAYDLLCLRVMNWSFYGSPRLAELLTSERVTGIEIVPAGAELVFPD